MNFEDERYVRVYTRKTFTTKTLGWEGRLVFWSLLVEVDRAGVLETGGREPALVVAAMCDLPLEVARVGIARCLELGAVEVSDRGMVIPRFIEAQEAKQSDKARQRESRGRRAAAMRCSEGAIRHAAEGGESPLDVTERDHMPSRIVTICHENRDPCHTDSAPVTPCRAVPIRAVPNLTERDPPTGDLPPSPRKRVARGWRKIPAGWVPNEDHRKLAAELDVSFELELAKIRDFEFARTRTDPDATFRTWLRTAAERQRRPRPYQGGNSAADNTKRAVERARRLTAEFEARQAANGEA